MRAIASVHALVSSVLGIVAAGIRAVLLIGGVSVTPDGATTPDRQANSGPYTATFTIKNTGATADTFSLGCSGMYGISCTGLDLYVVGLAPNATATVTATYTVGSTTGQLWVHAFSEITFAQDDGYYNVSVLPPPPPVYPLPAVTPDGDTTLVFRSLTGLQQQFYVKNVDTLSHAYTLTTACTGAASGCSVSSPITLIGGESRALRVQYQIGSSTTGTVKLFATQSDQSTVKDSGWVPLRTVASPYPVLSLSANTGRAVARGLCLTIAAGSSAAYECGDLRIVHPLPGIRTVNRERQPVLLYNSLHAAPYPVIVAQVTLPTGTLPDSVEAILRVNGVQKAISRWGGNNWVAGQTRQVGLGYDATADTTKVYDYTMEVATIFGTARYATALSGKLIIVNRATSAFGAGWWLAGLERLELLADGSKLWIGGDGSARQYVAVGPNLWLAQGVARPDTLKWDGTTYYVRVLASGDTVKFNSSGQQVLTRNRLGHQTTFGYTNGLLTSITLPSQGGSQQYSFTYTSSKLTQVTSPPNGSQTRIVTVTQSSGKVTQIKDPDLSTVGFGYAGNRITSRTDRRSTITRYSYGVANRLSRAKIELSATDSIRVSFQPAESAGFFNASPKTATDTALVYATYWGPRQYATGSDFIAQSTKFWLDPFGAPRKIQNPLNQITVLSRDDAEYRALVTRTQAPNGRVLKAGYDRRGNVAFSADSTNQNATTRYAWDAKWNSPTRMVPPMGDSVVIAYDANTGNPLWQQDARGSVSRVQFFYGSIGQLDSLQPAGQTSRYKYTYDTHRNLTKVRTPLGIETRMMSDAVGRDTLTKAPTGSGAIGAQTDSTWTRTTYDVMDRVASTMSYGPPVTYTNPRSLVQTTDSDYVEVVTDYDPEGNLTSMIRNADQDGYLTSYMHTTYTFDRANRPLTVQNSGKDSTVYDPAGNVVRTITSRGYTITATYDALNRLIRRQVPQVDYAQAGCAEHGLPAGCGYQFPLYPSPIAARTDTFAYDVVGNLVLAWNEFAHVNRTYNLDGTVATDSLRLRNYSGPTFTTHVYGMSYGYDLNGRRSRLTHPTNIDPASAVDQLYTYDASGALSSVRDVKNNYFRFYYDAQGRPDSLAYPVGKAYFVYDADGRLTERRDMGLQDDHFGYDQRGMISSVTGTRWTATNVYSGLGKLVMFNEQWADGTHQDAEEYRPDGLSSEMWRRNLGTTQDPEHQYNYDHVQSRLWSIVGIWPTGGPPQPQDWYPDTTYNVYDVGGNVRYSGWRQFYWIHSDPVTTSGEGRRASASFYAADGKLMVQQQYRDSINYYGIPQKQRGSYEEYWYDALGRRVLVRRRSDQLCTGGTSFCVSTLERFVWDGDQLLYELRAPGGDNLSGAQLDAVPPYSGGDYKQVGRVAYTHGPGIDAPLDLIRMDYNGAEYVVIPHQNWRGQYGAGTDPTGAQYGFNFEWPADFRGAMFTGGDGWGDQGLPEWFGSLIQDKWDQTGLLYKRNRYYDPNTGRFTQEDPIGLAGGLNLYGFASGDPVNFGDPFGLCKDKNGKEIHGPECDGPVINESWNTFWAVYGATEAGAAGLARAGGKALAEGAEGEVGGVVGWLKGLARRLIGRPYPTKQNSAGEQQPYDPANGQYLSPAVNPGLRESPLTHFVAGVGQGIGETQSGITAPAAVSNAQEWGQTIGKILGMLSNMRP